MFTCVHPFKIATIIILLLFAPIVAAQAPETRPTADVIITQQMQDNIFRTAQLINTLEFKRSNLLVELPQVVDPQRRQQIENSLKELQSQLEDLNATFIELATGVNLSGAQATATNQSIDWLAELNDVLAPVLNEIKKITSEPREIDRLKNSLTNLQSEQIKINSGLERLNALQKISSSLVIQPRVVAVAEEWQMKKNQIDNTLAFTAEKLRIKQQSKKSLGEGISDLFAIFFKDRGRNVLVAVLATFLFLVVAKSCHQYLIQRRTSLIKTYLSLRFFTVAYYFLSVCGAILVPVAVLYLFGDWVLLIICLLIFLAVVWASKQALPRFWSQLLLLSNMGTVREGERVLYKGLPWDVKTLNLFTELVNPRLLAEPLKIPIQDLINLRSYPGAVNSESLFPTAVGDWVLFEDQLACVQQQNIDFVNLELLGGAIITYQTKEFVEKPIMNISNGFRLQYDLELNLAQSDDVFNFIPQILLKHLDARFTELSYREFVRNINVEYCGASKSAYHIAVIIDFSGIFAAKYNILKRMLPRLAHEACLKNNWPLSRELLNVHLNQASSDGGVI